MNAERWLIAGALLLFGLSLLLPAIEGSGFPAQSGLDVLGRGAGAWRDGVIAWYANPILAFALALAAAGRNRTALALGFAGLLLALSSFRAGESAVAAGSSVPPFSFGIGFYIWLGAFLLAMLAAGVGIYKVSSRRV